MTDVQGSSTASVTPSILGIGVLRAGSVSVRVDRRLSVATAALILATVAATALHIAFGGTPLPYREVLAALFGDQSDHRIYLAVTEFRAPRTVAAVVVGASLAAAGAITQTVARNPLASPDLLGVTAGASFGAVAVLVIAGGGHAGLSGFAAGIGMPMAAFGTGLASGIAVYLLAYRQTLDSYRLVLAGLGVSGLATSLTTWMLTLGDVTSAGQALTWMMGSLNGKDWGSVQPMALSAVVLVLGAGACGKWLSLTTLDEDTVTGLGARIGLIRLVVLTLAVLLASVATVTAGPIGFVALASPRIARALTSSTIPTVGASAFVGAIFVLISDTLAANLLSTPLPVGVATAVIGAPFLIYLILRSQQRQR